MDTSKITKEIMKERIESEVEKHSLLMKADEVQKILGIDDHAQLYRMMNNGQIAGAQKIPGMGWRVNRDIFFTWLYSGEEEESKPFKPVRRVK